MTIDADKVREATKYFHDLKNNAQDIFEWKWPSEQAELGAVLADRVEELKRERAELMNKLQTADVLMERLKDENDNFRAALKAVREAWNVQYGHQQRYWYERLQEAVNKHVLPLTEGK